ncbi:MAG: Uma2 family endonuclease [Sedimentibacter sp.]
MENLVHKIDIPYELLDGKVVYMTPRPSTIHNMVVTNITAIFHNYLKGKKCIPFSDGVDVFLDENNNVIPDVIIVCNPDIIKADGIYGVPDLIVEVLSPTTARNDKGYKKTLYGKCRVKEYWIVDTNNKSVEVYLQKNGLLELDNIYSIFPDYILNKINQEDKDKIEKEFKTILFDDLRINIEDIFYRIV